MAKDKKLPNFKKVTKKQLKKENGVIKSSKEETIITHNENVAATGNGKTIVIQKKPLTKKQKILVGASVGAVVAMGLAIGLPFAFNHSPATDFYADEVNKIKNGTPAEAKKAAEDLYKGGDKNATLSPKQTASADALATYIQANKDEDIKVEHKKGANGNNQIVIHVKPKASANPSKVNNIKALNDIYANQVNSQQAKTTTPTTSAGTTITLVIYNKETVKASSNIKPAPTGMDFVDAEWALAKYIETLDKGALTPKFESTKGTDVTPAIVIAKVNTLIGAATTDKLNGATATDVQAAFKDTMIKISGQAKEAVTIDFEIKGMKKTITLTAIGKMSPEAKAEIIKIFNALSETDFVKNPSGKASDYDAADIVAVLHTKADTITPDKVKEEVKKLLVESIVTLSPTNRGDLTVAISDLSGTKPFSHKYTGFTDELQVAWAAVATEANISKAITDIKAVADGTVANDWLNGAPTSVTLTDSTSSLTFIVGITYDNTKGPKANGVSYTWTAPSETKALTPDKSAGPVTLPGNFKQFMSQPDKDKIKNFITTLTEADLGTIDKTGYSSAIKKSDIFATLTTKMGQDKILTDNIKESNITLTADSYNGTLDVVIAHSSISGATKTINVTGFKHEAKPVNLDDELAKINGPLVSTKSETLVGKLSGDVTADQLGITITGLDSRVSLKFNAGNYDSATRLLDVVITATDKNSNSKTKDIKVRAAAKKMKTVYFIDGDTTNSGHPTEYNSEADAKTALDSILKPQKIWKVTSINGKEFDTKPEAIEALFKTLTINSIAYNDSDIKGDTTQGIDVSNIAPANTKQVFVYNSKAFNTKAKAITEWLKDNPDKKAADIELDWTAPAKQADILTVKGFIKTDADLAKADTKVVDSKAAKVADVNTMKAFVTDADLVKADTKVVDSKAAKVADVNTMKAFVTDADLAKADTKVVDSKAAKVADVNTMKAFVTDADLVKADTKVVDSKAAKVADVNTMKAFVTDADLVKADTKVVDSKAAKVADVNTMKAFVTDADLAKADTKVVDSKAAKVADVNTMKAFVTDADLVKADTKVVDSKAAKVADVNTMKAFVTDADLVKADTSTDDSKAPKAKDITAVQGLVAGDADFQASGKYNSLIGKYVDKTTYDAAVITAASTLGGIKAIFDELHTADGTTTKPSWTNNNDAGKYAGLSYADKNAYDTAVTGKTVGELKTIFTSLQSKDNSIQEPKWAGNNDAGKYAGLRYADKNAYDTAVTGKTVGELKTIFTSLQSKDNSIQEPKWAGNNDAGKYAGLSYADKNAYDTAVTGKTVGELKTIFTSLQSKDNSIQEPKWAGNNDAGKYAGLTYADKNAYDTAVTGKTVGELKTIFTSLQSKDNSIQEPKWAGNNDAGKYAGLSYADKNAYDTAVTGKTVGELKTIFTSLQSKDNSIQEPKWAGNNDAGKYAGLTYADKNAYDTAVTGKTVGELKTIFTSLQSKDNSIQEPKWAGNNDAGKYAGLTYADKNAYDTAVTGKTVGELKTIFTSLQSKDNSIQEPKWAGNNDAGKYAGLTYADKNAYNLAVDGATTLADLKAIYVLVNDAFSTTEPSWLHNNASIANVDQDAIDSGQINPKNIKSNINFNDGDQYQSTWEPTTTTTLHHIDGEKTKAFDSIQNLKTYWKTTLTTEVSETNSATKVQANIGGNITKYNTKLDAQNSLIKNKKVEDHS